MHYTVHLCCLIITAAAVLMITGLIIICIYNVKKMKLFRYSYTFFLIVLVLMPFIFKMSTSVNTENEKCGHFV